MNEAVGDTVQQQRECGERSEGSLGRGILDKDPQQPRQSCKETVAHHYGRDSIHDKDNEHSSDAVMSGSSDGERRSYRRKKVKGHHKKKRHHKERRQRSSRESRHRHNHRGHSDDSDDPSESRSRSRRSSRSPHCRNKREQQDYWSHDKYYESSSYSDESDGDYKKEEPNSSIMIRGLAMHLTEEDVREDILSCGIVARDIRVIRHRDSGVSRGFAFVEFNSTLDATTWMEMRKGALTLHQKYNSTLVYCSPRLSSSEGNSQFRTSEWHCPNCQGYNFKRREVCYKCRAPRPGLEDSESGETSSHPTCTVILSNLDALTVEENVLQAFHLRPGLSSIPFRSVRIGRDKMTNVSCGTCYVDLNNMSDANRVYSALKEDKLVIDDREVSVAYCKTSTQTNSAPGVARQALAAAQWSVNATSETYSPEKLEELARYSAAHYAKTPEEHRHYLEYYREYYRKQFSKDTSSEAGESQTHGSKTNHDNSIWASGTGVFTSNRADSTNNVNYEASYNNSGDILSPQKKDGRNSKAGVKMLVEPVCKSATKKQSSEKLDKLSEAKKIASDMEKWAKSLNQRKDIPKPSIPNYGEFSKGRESFPAAAVQKEVDNNHLNAVNDAYSMPMYISRPAEADRQRDIHQGRSHIDERKLSCLLCRRQFSNIELLTKHVELSDLHRRNLVEASKNSASY